MSNKPVTTSGGMEKSRRPRLRDVAEKAGVHLSSVSLALRNQPGIGPEKRALIKKIAAEMGYRPDPNLDAYNFQRTINSKHAYLPTIAFISDHPTISRTETCPECAPIFKGAASQCKQLGFKLERFLTGPQQLPQTRLNTILESRNITAVIVVSCSGKPVSLNLNWSRLSSLQIHSFQFTPCLDTFCANMRQAARKAVEELVLLGSTRIGLAFTEEAGEHDRYLYEMGYRIELSKKGFNQDIPLFAGRLPDLVSDTKTAKNILHWIQIHQIDTVVSPSNSLLRYLSKNAVTAGLRLASLDYNADENDENDFSGVDLRRFDLGKKTVDALFICIKASRLGLPDSRSTTYCPVKWKSK